MTHEPLLAFEMELRAAVAFPGHFWKILETILLSPNNDRNVSPSSVQKDEKHTSLEGQEDSTCGEAWAAGRM